LFDLRSTVGESINLARSIVKSDCAARSLIRSAFTYRRPTYQPMWQPCLNLSSSYLDPALIRLSSSFHQAPTKLRPSFDQAHIKLWSSSHWALIELRLRKHWAFAEVRAVEGQTRTRA